jgi:hypothetical protein
MSTHTASTPRRIYWSEDVGGVADCPECRGRLTEHRHSYLMVVRKGRRMDSFVVGGQGVTSAAIARSWSSRRRNSAGWHRAS